LQAPTVSESVTIRVRVWSADGIHTGLRSEQSEGQSLLVIISVTLIGRKERVVIGDGYRESKELWKEPMTGQPFASGRLTTIFK